MNIAITGGDALTAALARAEALHRAREARERAEHLAALCEELLEQWRMSSGAVHALLCANREDFERFERQVADYRARLAALRGE